MRLTAMMKHAYAAPQLYLQRNKTSGLEILGWQGPSEASNPYGLLISEEPCQPRISSPDVVLCCG